MELDSIGQPPLKKISTAAMHVNSAQEQIISNYSVPQTDGSINQEMGDIGSNNELETARVHEILPTGVMNLAQANVTGP